MYLQQEEWIGEPVEGFALDVGGAWPVAGRDYPWGGNWSVGLAWQCDLELP